MDWHLVTILFHLNVQSQQGETEVVTILFQALPLAISGTFVQPFRKYSLVPAPLLVTETLMF